jgi:hypothetical protein
MGDTAHARRRPALSAPASSSYARAGGTRRPDDDPGLIGWVIRAPQLVQPCRLRPSRPWSFLVILAASVAGGDACVVHTAATLTVLCAVIGLALMLNVPLPLDAA